MIDKSKISSTRFMFGIAFFLQSSVLLKALVVGVSLQDSWLMFIIGFFVSIPLILLFRTIMVMFPDKNFIQVLKIIFGKFAGTIIGMLYLWFFITLAALNFSDLGDFAKLSVMYQTPKALLLLFCAFVIVYTIRKGLSVVMRYSGIFTFFKFFVVFLTIVFTFNQMNFDYFQPLLTLEPMKYIQSIHIISTIPIGEIVVFLMITPNVKMEKKGSAKYWILGLFMGVITVFATLVRDIAVLGNTINMFSLPGLITLRLINAGPALSRVEILFSVAFMLLLFVKVTFLSYVSLVAIAELFNTKNFKNLVFITVLLIFSYALIVYPDPIIHSNNAQKITPFIWTIFEIVFPLLVFILAKIRGLPKKQHTAKHESTILPKLAKKQRLLKQKIVPRGENT